MDFETGSGFAILVSTDLKYWLCDRTQSERSGDLTAYLANKTLLRLTKQFVLCTMKLKSIILKKKIFSYWVVHKLPQIYTANHATFPIQILKITVQICGNFWVTQYAYINRFIELLFAVEKIPLSSWKCHLVVKNSRKTWLLFLRPGSPLSPPIQHSHSFSFPEVQVKLTDLYNQHQNQNI